MALRNASLFNYGLQITPSNQYISFAMMVGQTPPNSLTATIQVGFYSLSSLATAIETAFISADPTNVYTVSINRSYGGGLQNRLTISSTSSYFSIFFGTGNALNPAALLGFASSDLTGSTSYVGTSSAGVAFVPNSTLSNTQIVGFNYLPTQSMQKLQGSVNISASGVKEAITFSIMQFWQVQFQYITEGSLSTDWLPLVQWLVQQRQIEFTPDVTNPSVFYAGTLDDPSGGLDFMFSEMLPNFPFLYKTPLMKFRLANT